MNSVVRKKYGVRITMSAPPKRPLFNKPAWSNPSQLGGADDLFHRSNQTYVKIAAEAEERRKKKIAKLEQDRKSENATQGRPGKRRRVSDESDDDGDSSSSEENPNGPTKVNSHFKYSNVPTDRESGLPISVKSTPTSESLPKPPDNTVTNHKQNNGNALRASNVIDLEDEDSQPGLQEEDVDVQAIAPGTSGPPEDDDFPVSDEEFPELAMKARETARRKLLEADSQPATQYSSYEAESDPRSHNSKSLREPTPPRLSPDPIVQILITSQIPGTEPLIVSRKISQRLKDVRLAWCERQHFAPEFIPAVFLTWRGNRLFDVTTCKSLGIGVDADGDILLKGRKDIMGEEDRQIHMEATTDEIIAGHQKTKQHITDKNEDDELDEDFPVQNEKEAQLRIILKAKGFEDFKLIVKPVCTFTPYYYCSNDCLQTTLVSRIVFAFRSDKKIGSDREVFLSFDGERLTPTCKVEETELNDMDYVDVYVK